MSFVFLTAGRVSSTGPLATTETYLASDEYEPVAAGLHADGNSEIGNVLRTVLELTPTTHSHFGVVWNIASEMMLLRQSHFDPHSPTARNFLVELGSSVGERGINPDWELLYAL